VGSGTAGEVTTDVSANGYEVTVTRSDGSKVEAHLDQSFNPDDRGRLGTDRSATGRSRAGPVRLPVLDATT
jgi:hypothetical protein